MKSFVAVLVASCLIGCATPARTRELIGQPLPPARVFLSSGEVVPAFLGKEERTILFWSRTCSASREVLLEAHRFASANPEQFIVAINVDGYEDRDEVAGFIEQHDLRKVLHGFSGNGPYDEAFIAVRGEMVPLIVTVSSRGRVTAVRTFW